MAKPTAKTGPMRSGGARIEGQDDRMADIESRSKEWAARVLQAARKDAETGERPSKA